MPVSLWSCKNLAAQLGKALTSIADSATAALRPRGYVIVKILRSARHDPAASGPQLLFLLLQTGDNLVLARNSFPAKAENIRLAGSFAIFFFRAPVTSIRTHACKAKRRHEAQPNHVPHHVSLPQKLHSPFTIRASFLQAPSWEKSIPTCYRGKSCRFVPPSPR
jgi:hypothetical protein